MNINIRATNMELTGPVRSYVNEKIGYLSKFIEGAADAYVELGRTSNHHQKGEEVFFVEAKVKSGGSEYYGREDAGDLFAAIDQIKEELQREIAKNKDRNQTLFVRGARKIKKRIKGMKPWWPFGGKGE